MFSQWLECQLDLLHSTLESLLMSAELVLVLEQVAQITFQSFLVETQDFFRNLFRSPWRLLATKWLEPVLCSIIYAEAFWRQHRVLLKTASFVGSWSLQRSLKWFREKNRIKQHNWCVSHTHLEENKAIGAHINKGRETLGHGYMETGFNILVTFL